MSGGLAPAPRLPVIGWLGGWPISIASLLLGFGVLFVFRRGLPHVGWIVGYLLLLWLLSVFVTALRGSTPVQPRRGVVVTVGDYTIQTLYHNLLLFVLPAYYAAATLDSPNALFPALVAAGALVTAVDPLYRWLVHPRPWLNHALLGFSFFAALNVALPLVGAQSLVALEGSAVLSALALAPAFRRAGASTWVRAHGLALASAVAALVLIWYGRPLVPPAPLFLARAVLAQGVAELEPVEPVPGGVISAATVLGWGEMTAFTAVYAPAGVRQPIAHVWWREGERLAHVILPTPIRGGRRPGFRTYSRYTDLKPPVAGRYRIDVVTASGQLIGRLRFLVTP